MNVLTTSFYNVNNTKSNVLYGFIDQQASQATNVLFGQNDAQPATTTNNNLTNIFGQLDTALNTNNCFEVPMNSNGSINVGSIGQMLAQIFTPQVDPQQQANLEKRNAIHEQLNQLAESRDQMLSGQVQADPQRLQALAQAEKALIEQMKTTYPENSPEAKALDTTVKSMELDAKEHAIKAQMAKIEAQAMQLLGSVANIDPGSAEAQQLQARLEAMMQIQVALQQELVKTKEEQKVVNNNLTSDLMACPREDRQLIADIKRDQVHSQGVLHKATVDNLSQMSTAIKEYLNNDGIDPQIKATLEMRLELVNNQLKEEKNEMMKSSFQEFMMNILMF